MGEAPCSHRFGNYLIAVISLEELMWETTQPSHMHIYQPNERQLIELKKKQQQQKKKPKQNDP